MLIESIDNWSPGAMLTCSWHSIDMSDGVEKLVQASLGNIYLRRPRGYESTEGKYNDMCILCMLLYLFVAIMIYFHSQFHSFFNGPRLYWIFICNLFQITTSLFITQEVVVCGLLRGRAKNVAINLLMRLRTQNNKSYEWNKCLIYLYCHLLCKWNMFCI